MIGGVIFEKVLGELGERLEPIPGRLVNDRIITSAGQRIVKAIETEITESPGSGEIVKAGVVYAGGVFVRALGVLADKQIALEAVRNGAGETEARAEREAAEKIAQQALRGIFLAAGQ